MTLHAFSVLTVTVFFPGDSSRSSSLSVVRIAIAGRSEDYCVPCGACRQVMQEFAPQMEVICLNDKGEAKHFALKELLPYGFDETWL